MPEAPDGSIIITPKEFYDGVRNDISTIVSEVGRLREDFHGLPQRVDKLEIDVDQVKSRQVWMAGFAAGAGAVLGSVASRLFV